MLIEKLSYYHKELTVLKGTKGSGKRSGEVKSGMHMVLTIAKVSKYFLNLEKRSKSQMHIRKLIDSSGAEVTEPKFVLSMF